MGFNDIKLSAREVGILFNSSVISKYSQIKGLLKEYKSFNTRSIENLELKEFCQTNLLRVLEMANDEWEVMPQKFKISEKGEICQLCGQPHIKEINWIKNKVNGNELKVGSTCIINCEIASQVDLDKIYRNNIRAELIAKLPRIEEIALSFLRTLDSYPIVIPRKERAKYIELGTEIKLEFNRWTSPKKINKRMTAKDISKLRGLISRFEVEEKNIEKYVESYKQKTIINRQMFNWLINNRTRENSVAIDEINRTGDIGVNSIWRIEAPDLLNSLYPSLNQKFNPLGINFLSVSNGKYYDVSCYISFEQAQYKMMLLVPHDSLYQECIDFIANTGEFLEADWKNVLEKSIISNESENLVLSIFNNYKLGDIRINPEWKQEEFIRMDEVLLVQNNKYGVIKVKNLIAMAFLYMLGSISKENFLFNIKRKVQTWYSKKDMDDILFIRANQN